MAMQLDDFGTLAKQQYVDTLKVYNSQVEQAKSVSSIEEFTTKFMETSPELADLNEKIEKLESALEGLKGERLVKGTPLVQPAYDEAVKNSGVDIPALDEALKKIRLMAKFLTGTYGDEVLEDTEKVASRAKSGGNTTGGKRIHGFEVYIDGKRSIVKVKNKETNEVVEKSSISAAAKDLKVETVTLQRAFFDAAGMEDYKSESFPDVVDFEFQGHNVKVAKLDEDESE